MPAQPISQRVSEIEANPKAEQRQNENLPLLYQSLLTGILRIKTNKQGIADGSSFRRRTRTALQEVERVATTIGYESRDIRDTQFAVVAFLDAVILNSKDPVRAEWERMPMALELYGYADAGVVFFEKLEQFRSRRNSEELADVLELYLLCLLLGFEGRYSGAHRGELEATIEGLRMRIEDIRGRRGKLSPGAELPAVIVPLSCPTPRLDRLGLIAGIAAIVTILCFMALKWDLASASATLRTRLF
jgi:type VI secretion system protein ImpK